MIADLKPYPTMKESGIEWLGDVPEHWDVHKLRSILTGVTERNRPELPLLSVVREKGIILRDVANMDENHNFIPDDLTNYKVVHKGQFAMNKMKAWQGSYGVSRHAGIVSPAYFIFDISEVTRDYFHVAVRSKSYVPFFTQASDGVRIGQWDLSQARMREIPLLVPSNAEQAAIVRYLDHADRRIRRYIHAKQKLVKLLEEQQQALIHQSVTRGLDPNVHLKPSGVEWLGDVPEHWDVLSLCAVATHKSVTGQQHRELLSVYLDRGVIRFSEMQEKRTNVTSADLTKYQAVDPGDFVLNNQQAWRGSVGVSSLSGIVSPAYLVLALSGRLHTDFANLLFRDRAMVDQYLICSRGVGSIQRNLYWPHLKRVTFPSSPISEQATIVRFLDEAAADIAAAIDRARRQIVLWREYRTRLIADVVTGKLDVRSVAARLPDEIKEPEPLDQADPLIDGEEEPIKAATTREAAV